MPTVQRAADALKVAPCRIVKSLVLRETKHKPARLCVAIVPGDRSVDFDKVASVLGLTSLRLAPAEVVAREIGFEVGGVPPIGHLTCTPVVVDQAVISHDVVFGGGGDKWHMLRISPTEIIRATSALVADVTTKACT
jgi:Cys-tRNA(Pro) deacylase